jgi:Pao retrotransposon peptidase.
MCLKTKCTKRIILSTVARIFDILGFVSPITINMKLLIKDLWTSKVDWDETPPLLIQERWSQIVSELPVLNTLKIPRHLSIQIHSSVSLVGFCDASERAMGACVYVHVVHPDNSTHVHLACAKSKVAPMKYVTIPRLELCAALLLSKLLLVVTETFAARYDIQKYFLLHR